MKTSDVLSLQKLEKKYKNLIVVGLATLPSRNCQNATINKNGEIGKLKWIYSNRLNMGKN